MHNYGADISRLTMMVLRCGLILLELLGLLHLPRLFSLQFERLVLGRHGAKRAGCLFAYADGGVDQGSRVGALRPNWLYAGE